MARDIFISYSQPDRDCANELTQHLEASRLHRLDRPAGRRARRGMGRGDHRCDFRGAGDGSRVFREQQHLAAGAAGGRARRSQEPAHPAVSNRGRRAFPEPGVFPERAALARRVPGRRASCITSGCCACLRQWLPPPTAHPIRPQAAAASAPPRMVIHGFRISAEQRRELETRLTRILGPIAGLLIDRMAVGAADCADLERRLAAELDSEDQQRFLQARQ